LAGKPPLIQRRIVEKWKAHRALDLERAIAGQKHRRRVGFDSLHLLPAMTGRIGEKGEHLPLAVRCLGHTAKILICDMLLGSIGRAKDWTIGACRGNQSLQRPGRRIGCARSFRGDADARQGQ
jgi:hypothetical protein